MKDLRVLKDSMYNLSATDKLQDGGTHFATLLTITSSSSSSSVLKKLDGRGSPSDDTGTSSGEDRVRDTWSSARAPCGVSADGRDGGHPGAEGGRQRGPPSLFERDVARLRAAIRLLPERDFFIDNLLVRIHCIIVMIRWTGLAPWGFEFPFPGSLTSTFLGLLPHASHAASSCVEPDCRCHERE